MFYYVYDTPIGKITLTEENGKLSGLYFGEHAPEGCDRSESAVMKEAYRQLRMYFDGELKEFTVPFEAEGTEFRKKVWKQLCGIPYGETITYGELARRVGDAKASRAVGGANHNNPISIIIPCHRVVGADGGMVGYGGGIPVKEFLLELEKRYSRLT